MATEALTAPVQEFSHLPPFPSDVPTAPLLRLSLSSLLARDPDEIARFTAACEDLGFFYLDLSTSSPTLGTNLLRDADSLFSVGEALFDLPVSEKTKYDFSKSHNSYFGYKGFGANVIDRAGNLDRNEFYNVSKDDVLEQGTRWPAPTVLDEQRDLLARFTRGAHEVVSLVLELLNEYLKLPKGTLQNMHRLEGISGDQTRFIKAPPQPKDDRRTALGEHTDFGSVTVLFNRLGGLQVLPPGRDAEWCYVKPLPGHAIINLGDAMVKFTNGRLRSNIHRVNAPPGEQADVTRYSLVYFNRPEDDVVLKRLDSEMIPELEPGAVEEEVKSKDWIIRRALGRRPGVVGTKAFEEDAGKGTEDLSRRYGGGQKVVASAA
jgi:isopenicillin N synthase-like dioxygenase